MMMSLGNIYLATLHMAEFGDAIHDGMLLQVQIQGRLGRVSLIMDWMPRDGLISKYLS